MTRAIWSHILVIVGFVAMLVGAIDPLEGSVIILPGIALAAIGALVGRSRYRILLCASLVFVAAGIGGMFALSAVGGIGGTTGRPAGWWMVIAPYPIGWLMGVVGVILRLVEAFRHPEPVNLPAPNP